MSPLPKFYFSPGACSIAGQILLEDSGLRFEATKVNIHDPASRAEYLKTVNAKGQVPTLQLGDQIITEAPAIITAISQLIPGKNYTGTTQLETVRFYEWINFLSGTLHTKSFGGLFKPDAFSDEQSAHDGIVAKSKQNIASGLATIEEKLASNRDQQFAIGNNLTGVDAYLVVYMLWAERRGFDLEPYPNYVSLFEKLIQMPAVKATLDKQV